MNLHQLTCFLTVAKCMSFSRAAEELFMTQTAVTYQISQLEKELATRLFDRSHQRISLTPAGAVFVDCARRIVDDMRVACERVSETARFSGGVLNVACFGDVLYPFLPRLLAAFRKLTPNVSVRLSQHKARDIVEGLHGDVVDVGIITGYGGLLSAQSRIDSALLFRDQHYAILPADHKLASRRSITMAELYENNAIMYAEKDLFSREEDTGEFHSITFVDDPQSVNVLVAAGYGVSVSVGHVRDVGNPLLAFVPIEGAYMDVFACKRHGDVSNLTQTFFEMLTQTDYKPLLRVAGLSK